MSVLDKSMIQLYLQHGMGQLVLDTSSLIVGCQIVSIDQYVVSVRVRNVLLGEEDVLVGERLMVSTVVENPARKQVYGINLHEASPKECFILFLRDAGHGFLLSSVSNPQSILLGSFRVQSEENLATFAEAMRFLDAYLLPEGSSLAEEFPGEPSLPACDGCLFLMRRGEIESDGPLLYQCGRIWTPASLRGWQAREMLEQHGEEYGEKRPGCWTGGAALDLDLLLM